jgi:hypothetical protein
MGKMSLDDFERWFRRSSRNVHDWGNPELIEAVLTLEAALSEYRFADLGETAIGKELAIAIRPFVSEAGRPEVGN